MPSWEFPAHPSSLLHAAKFQSDSGEEAAEDIAEASAAAVTGQEEIAGEKALAALEKLATETGSMDLWFENGRVYTFFNVPRSVYQELLAATSPGSYYNANIRGRYSG